MLGRLPTFPHLEESGGEDIAGFSCIGGRENATKCTPPEILFVE